MGLNNLKDLETVIGNLKKDKDISLDVKEDVNNTSYVDTKYKEFIKNYYGVEED